MQRFLKCQGCELCVGVLLPLKLKKTPLLIPNGYNIWKYEEVLPYAVLKPDNYSCLN